MYNLFDKVQIFPMDKIFCSQFNKNLIFDSFAHFLNLPFLSQMLFIISRGVMLLIIFYLSLDFYPSTSIIASICKFKNGFDWFKCFAQKYVR
jgi:hypothetical protein